MSQPPSAAPDHTDVWVPPPLILAGFFALGALLERRFPATPIPAPWRWISSGLCLAASGGIFAWGLACFTRARTSPVPFQRSAVLLTSGPYRFSRNPLYVSAALLYAGLALWWKVLWALPLLPLALAALRRLVINKEEGFLERRFGMEYLDYKKRVRRWL